MNYKLITSKEMLFLDFLNNEECDIYSWKKEEGFVRVIFSNANKEVLFRMFFRAMREKEGK